MTNTKQLQEWREIAAHYLEIGRPQTAAWREAEINYPEAVVQLVADNAALRAEVERLRGGYAELWEACEQLPHAADCDPDGTGYCTCARGEFNSMLNNLRPAPEAP